MTDKKTMPETKETMQESLVRELNELKIVENMKKAMLDYVLIYEDDYEEYENTFYQLLGRLEISVLRRKQMILETQKALMG